METHLGLVPASLALERVVAEVGDGDESAEVADVDPIRIADLEEALAQKLRRPVSNLTVTFHFTETQATVPG